MITAVLDTNVLASGTVSASTAPGQILNAWRDSQFELVISQHIIDELVRVLNKPYFQTRLEPSDITAFIDLLQNETMVTPITVNIQSVATHPEDDLIIATALSAHVNYLVTGDGPLLRKVGNSYQNVKLVTPNKFLKILSQQS